MRDNEEILLPHGAKIKLAEDMGLTRATVRLYLRGYYPKTSESWDKQQECRRRAKRLLKKA